MTCRYCHRQHGAGVLCEGVTRRAFFFFGAAAAVAPFAPAPDRLTLGIGTYRHIKTQLVDTFDDGARSIVGRDFNGVPVLGELEGPINQLAQGLIKRAGVGHLQVDGVDLSDHIKAIDLDKMHRQLEAGERDRDRLGLRKLEPFEVTLSGFWEGATVTGKA